MSQVRALHWEPNSECVVGTLKPFKTITSLGDYTDSDLKVSGDWRESALTNITECSAEVARLVWDQDVESSILSTPTKI